MSKVFLFLFFIIIIFFAWCLKCMKTKCIVLFIVLTLTLTLTLPVVYGKPMITKTSFQYLFCHVYTLEISDYEYFSKCSSSFLEYLLEGLVSNPSTLQYLYLNIGYDCSYQKYGEVISTIAPFFSPSRDVDPLLSLKVVKIAANFRILKSVEIKELTAIISSQEHLETLEISATNTYFLCTSLSLRKEIFQVMASCFQKPNFQCLILENLYVRLLTFLMLNITFWGPLPAESNS